MTAIGVLSLFFGGLGLLLSALVILGSVQIEQSLGGVESALSHTSDREFVTQRMVGSASQTERELAEARAMILPDGIINACISLWLAVTGIGTLRMHPWARWSSLGWALVVIVWTIVIFILEPVEFSSMSLLLLVYPVTLIASFSQRKWRTAFSRGSTVSASA